jgi:hypothetical protein
MPIANTQPPQTPWVIYATPNASTPALWDLVRSQGTAIATGVAQSAVITTVANFMRTASADLSTVVAVVTPSGNPLAGGFPAMVNAQLGDLPTS